MAWNESEHPRDEDGKFTNGAPESSAERLKRVKEKYFPHLTEERKGDIISGARSGAIDPNSNSGIEKATLLYEQIRRTKTDISAIVSVLNKAAPDLKISYQDIYKIKRYLFIDEHDLIDGHRCFDPDADIADSWIRLKNGCPQLHDITMIRHELYEMALVAGGLSQDEAHKLAQEKYDYAKECGDYHGKDHKRKMRR